MFFLIPFENAVVAISHKVLGTFFFLAHPTFIILILSLAKFSLRFVDFIFLSLLFGFIVSSFANQSNYADVLPFVFLFSTAYFSGRKIDFSKYANTLFYGLITAGFLTVVLYIHYNYRIYSVLEIPLPSLDQILIYNRYIDNLPEQIKSSTFFHFFIGNTNKASNLVLLYSLLILFCLKKKILSPRVSTLALSMNVVLQMIYFSRGAILMGFLCAISIFFIDYFFNKKSFTKLTLFMALPFIFSLSTAKLRDYWVNFSSIDVRLEQQKNLMQSNSKLKKSDEGSLQYAKRLVFGYGPGGYGKTYYGNSHAGTHNFFIDTYLSGGVIGFLSILGLFCFPIFILLKELIAEKRIVDLDRACSLVLLIGLTIVLSMRELDFVYIFKLNQFGFVFFLIYFFVLKFKENDSEYDSFSSKVSL